ncbi:MAG: molybdopterin-dependent oxidoreductase [Gammaproteobacteria bacterium]
MTSPTTHATACILCSRNCGLLVEKTGDEITRIRGDKDHPNSRGYICQKAARIDYYQNNTDRLDAPLRRMADGGFEKISWDQALADIAERLTKIRDRHGGRAFAFYGGGGQGNHLGAVYGAPLLKAMRSQYHYSALAQEKTGDFWVNGRLFGRQTCHVTEDVENADLVLFIGTNPWQAHGIPNARQTLRELSKSPERRMIVIDPRVTKTAQLADVHLRLKPGTDAFLLAAMLAIFVRESLVDRDFIAAHTNGFEDLERVLRDIPVDAFIDRTGVSRDAVYAVAREFATAKRACVRADLGIQQSLHSTLNSYLEKLLFLLTGNFGKCGGNNLHTFLLPLIGHSDPPGEASDTWSTVVSGIPAISKLFPPNALPQEIDTDHPERVRALWVDSANPAMSGADTEAYRRAFAKLDLMVVVDVAMSETAERADYVLPASSQLEKWEATFFNLEFPTNYFHLREPLFEPRGDTLPEQEIYRRLLVAMGELPDAFPVLRQVARLDRAVPRLRVLPAALGLMMKLRPALIPYGAHVLQQTLGASLPDGASAAAPLWFAAHRYVARHGAAVRRALGDDASGVGDHALGELLFARIVGERSGTLISTHRYEDTWSLVRHPDRRIRLDIPELLDELGTLREEQPASHADFPLVLIAGERRKYNANTIFRNPAWRGEDADGALRLHPTDADRLGLADGVLARCVSAGGEIEVTISVCDSTQPGVVTLPHGYGLRYTDAAGRRRSFGPAVNELTSSDHRDPIAGTPYHKYVPVRLEAVDVPPRVAVG